MDVLKDNVLDGRRKNSKKYIQRPKQRIGIPLIRGDYRHDVGSIWLVVFNVVSASNHNLILY